MQMKLFKGLLSEFQKIFLILLFISGVLKVPAQKLGFNLPSTNCPRSSMQADIWYFGDTAGIDFRSGTAVPLTNENVMTAFKSSAVMSDSIGNLLFFTNGHKVWDRNFNQLAGSTSLDGDVGVGQPCLIVPIPDDPDKYIIFTNDVVIISPDNSYTTKGLRYTTIDMSLNNGLGDTVAKSVNLPLMSPACQKLTGMYDEIGKVYWVLVHKWESDQFYAYPVSKDGVGNPVITSIGSVHGGGFTNQSNMLGYMKFSPDGKQVALAISGSDKVELFDFNKSTGEVSNSQSYTFSKPNISPYGVEFSPDNKKLYTGLLLLTGNGATTTPSYICQFDLQAGLNNPVFVDSLIGIRTGALQLATDGRIYASRTINLLNKVDSLEVIYNPTRPGIDCNINLLNNIPGARFSLDGRPSIYSLPNFIQSYFNIPVFTYDSTCIGDVTKFHITNKANIDSVHWDFNDGGTSTIQDPMHHFTQPGTYWVTLTEKFNGNSFIDSMPVTIHSLPHVQLGDTILLYSGATINLHAGGGNMDYNWSTGATDSIIAVSDEGNYWVRVKDFNCCINSDSVYIKVFKYYIPSAFTPNGDGLNDAFKVIGLYRNIRFKMYIYNRWGQLLFESDNIDTGWDGTYKNSLCSADTYTWVINIDFLGQDIITKGNVSLKGSVILLR
jgi:gliding motility-associated-like protein